MAEEIDVLSWLVGNAKQAFYFDGRLYRMLSRNPKDGLKSGVRGRAHFADYDLKSNGLGGELFLYPSGQPKTTIPLNETIMAEGDVAILDGAATGIAMNRLWRQSIRERQFGFTDYEIYMMRRRRMGVVDYKIIGDNIGLRKMGVSTPNEWVVKPSITTVLDGFGPGKNAVVFETFNDVSSHKSETMVIAENSRDFTLCGLNIAFTSKEKAEAGKDFV